ncbi:hypothetical protein IAT40_001475 [Kwoniella sp. CBS 6097]
MTSNLPPRCPWCQLQQHPLFCTSCLQESISMYKKTLRNIRTAIDESTQKSKILLAGGQVVQATPSPGPIPRLKALALAGPSRGVNAWRQLRADVADKERRCAQLKKDIAEREARISRARTAVAESSITLRRANLFKVKSQSSPVIALQNDIKRYRIRQAEVSSKILKARSVLVKEAVAIFRIRQRSTGEWEIATLVLPSPEAFRLFPSVNINAALSHTIHLLSLLTTYLSITLPFIPTPPPPLEKRHIGRPLMRANTPFVGTTKWRDRNVLWMSSTASIASKVKTSSTGSRDSRKSIKANPPQGSMAMATSTLLSMTSNMSLQSSKLFAAQPQPSITAVLEKSMNKHRQFLTSFALLSFSVAYLAWSQGVMTVGILDRGGDGENLRAKDKDRNKDKDKDKEDSDDENPYMFNGFSKPRPPSRTQSRQSSTPTPTPTPTPSNSNSNSNSSTMISATSILELIAALAGSPGLGRKTHEPGTSHVVQHLGFGLDVAKVVQSVLSAEEGRWGTRKDDGSGEELSEGWDLLDAE